MLFLFLQGEHGVEEEVFLSLPAVLGHNGVVDVIRQPLTDKEAEQLRQSAALMAQVQAGIQFWTPIIATYSQPF